VRASGFNLVTSVRRGDHRLVAVVMGGRSAGERDSRMRELIERYIDATSTKHSAPLIAEAAEPAPAKKGTTYVTASAPNASVPVAEPFAGSLVTPAPGSSDPIKPLLVKTISVKAPTASAPAKNEAGNAAANASAAVASPPFPPPGARPGVLGVLPAAAAQVEPAVAAAQAYAAPALDGSAARIEPVVATKAEPSAPANTPAAHTGWMIQVGAFDAEDEAKQRLASARQLAKNLLNHADPFTETVVKGDKTYYRARFAGLEKEQAEAACKHLKRNDIACMPIKN
jgi:D-alanyl-D-alanine carboxypeptidase